MSSASWRWSRSRATASSGSRRCASPTSCRRRLVDSTTDSFVFEITGSSEQLDAFIHLMEPLGLAEVSRAGVVAIARGAEGL